MSFNFSPKIVTDSLVLYLDAANTRSYNGTETWFDLSGSENNGYFVNGPTFSSSNGGCISFDGTNDWITLTNNNLSNLVSSNKWTVGFWTKQNSFNIYSTFVIFNNQGLVFTKNQKVGILISGDNVKNSEVLELNKWYYVVGVNDSGVYSIYLNGVLSETSFLSDSGYNLQDNYSLGFKSSGATNTMGGLISNVQIYNRALSSSEITQNYKSIKSKFEL